MEPTAAATQVYDEASVWSSVVSAADDVLPLSSPPDAATAGLALAGLGLARVWVCVCAGGVPPGRAAEAATARSAHPAGAAAGRRRAGGRDRAGVRRAGGAHGVRRGAGERGDQGEDRCAQGEPAWQVPGQRDAEGAHQPDHQDDPLQPRQEAVGSVEQVPREAPR